MVVATVVAMVAAITIGEDKGVIIDRKQQNEKVTFWDNAFGAGNSRSYSNESAESLDPI
jgi:hypothetical protein